MRSRDVWMILSCVLSLVLSILTLIAGCKQGILDSVAIASYNYDGNYTLIYPATNETSPWTPRPQFPNDFINWFFSVHYLSICAGIEGGTEDPEYYHLECSPRRGGFTFRSDDPWIMDFMSENGTYFPVEGGPPPETINTMGPFATLVLGLAFSVISTVLLVCEIFGWGLSWMTIPWPGVTSMMLAATFLMASAALVTVAIRQSSNKYQDDAYLSWTSSFVGMTWSAVAFMYFCFVLKLSDTIIQKEKRTRLLQTGQI